MLSAITTKCSCI